jgi:WNK lysine deficient protein kinase
MDIEELVKDTAISTKRGLEKAKEWLHKLRAQDVMTVGDLRDLQEEDWQSL